MEINGKDEGEIPKLDGLYDYMVTFSKHLPLKEIYIGCQNLNLQ